MAHILTQRRVSRVVVGVLILGALASYLVLVPASWGIALMIVLGFAALFFGWRTTVSAGRDGVTTERYNAPRLTAHEQRVVVLQDGTQGSAQVISVDTDNKMAFVLTREGYAIVNKEGRVIHVLKTRGM